MKYTISCRITKDIEAENEEDVGDIFENMLGSLVFDADEYEIEECESD